MELQSVRQAYEVSCRAVADAYLDRETFRNVHENGVAEAQVQIELRPGHGGPVAHADQRQLLLEALRQAQHHVVRQAPTESKGPDVWRLFVIHRTGHRAV